MSVAVHVSSDNIRTPVGRAAVADVIRLVLRAEKIAAALVSVAFCTRREIAAVNRRHLDRAGPTDVIAFGFARLGAHDPVIGDIYIAPEVARANAAEAGVGVREEIVRLVVHGTLHVLGYDHPETDARLRSKMWERQEALVRRALARRRTSVRPG